MLDGNYGTTFKKVVDFAASVFILIPFICVIWIFAQLYTSSSYRLSDVTPLKILVADIIPTVSGVIWLASRYAKAIFARYPITTTWQFRLLFMFTPAALIVLGAVVRGTIRGLKGG
jgi:hypothetical protein